MKYEPYDISMKQHIHISIWIKIYISMNIINIIVYVLYEIRTNIWNTNHMTFI